MGGKKGKKRPITNGIHPGPSTSSSEGCEKKKKKVVKKTESETESRPESEPGSTVFGEQAMEWIIHPTTLQARTSTPTTSRKSRYTSKGPRVSITRTCFLPKLWRRQCESSELFMENTWI